ncbi:MAG: PatB family C-S lyase [Bacillota bacterium]|nr:PatB family C-S lyase [Bacillota bacterium]
MTLVKYVERKNTSCLKWDGLQEHFSSGNLLPLWVADMDFSTPDCVQEALKKYIGIGAYGYYATSDAYYNAFISWQKKRFGAEIQRDWIRFSPGVVSGFNWLTNIMTEPGDPVVLLTPVYYPFFAAVENNGRTLVSVDLLNDEGKYSIDFAALEDTIEKSGAKALIFSSPHNPIGRVWTADELERILQICYENGVFLICDEIHQDFVYGSRRQIPMCMIAEQLKTKKGYGKIDGQYAMLAAPSKTFNLAGCQNSFVMIPDESVREKWDRFAEGISVTDGNGFGYVAAQAAYEGGEAWLEELKEIILGNYEYAKSAVQASFEKAIVPPLEGTYLMWLDLSAYVDENNIENFMEEKCGLAVDYGKWFRGTGNGSCIRINLATKQEIIEKAMAELCKGLQEVVNENNR